MTNILLHLKPHHKKAISWVLILGIFAFLLSNTNIDQLVDVFFKLPRWTFPVLIAVNLSSIILQGFRWWMSLKVFKEDLPLGSVLKIHLISNYYSLAMPSGAGLDLTRGYLITRFVSASQAISSGWISRLQGLIAMIAFSFIGFILLGIKNIGNSLLIGSALFFLIIFTATWMTLNPAFATSVLKKIFKKQHAELDAFEHTLNDCKRNPTQLILGQFLSFAIQLLSFTSMYLLLLAVTQQSHFIEVITYVPLIEISSSLQPFTPNGLGVREALNAAFFTLLNVSPAQMSILLAISISVSLLRLVGLPFALADLKHQKKS